VRNLPFTPQNEMGVVHLFSLMQEELGCKIVEIKASYPDAIVEKDGKRFRVEFEYKASNFILHKHDSSMCDLIVCWLNDLSDPTVINLPILNLDSFRFSRIPVGMDKSVPHDGFYWMIRAIESERMLESFGCVFWEDDADAIIVEIF